MIKDVGFVIFIILPIPKSDTNILLEESIEIPLREVNPEAYVVFTLSDVIFVNYYK